MKRLVLIKLGGSLITDKSRPSTPRLDVIKNLVQQIKDVLAEDRELQLVIGNGGGSFPHYPAVEYGMKEGMRTEKQKKGFCLVQDTASELNRLLVRELLNAGLTAVSCNPSSMIIAREGKVKSFFFEPINMALKNNIIPVVYGDIVFDEVNGSHIFSTEKILDEVALRLAEQGTTVSQIIHVTEVEGVLDGKGAVIPLITKENVSEVLRFITETKGFDVTGGMLHKVQQSLVLAEKGISSMIMSGMKEQDAVKRALLMKQVTATIIK